MVFISVRLCTCAVCVIYSEEVPIHSNSFCKTFFVIIILVLK